MGYIQQRLPPMFLSLYQAFTETLIYSKLYLALLAAAEATMVLIILGYSLNLGPVVVGLITLSVYINDQLVDLKDSDVKKSDEQVFLQQNNDILYIFASVSYAIALGISAFGGLLTFIMALIPGVAWIVYASDLVRSATDRFGISFKRAKELFLINTSIVALAWSATIVLLPVGFADAEITPAVVILLGYFFLRVFGNVELVNVPDRAEDRQNNIRTFPIVFGVRGTQYGLYGLEILTITLVIFAVVQGYIDPIFAIPLIATVVYSLYIISQLPRLKDEWKFTRVAEYEKLIGFVALIGIVLIVEPGVQISSTDLTPTGISAILMVAIWVGTAVALLAWREYPEPGSLPLVIMLVGQVWWSVTLFLEFRVNTETVMLVLAELRWIGIVLIPVGWFLFAIEYTGYSRFIQPRYIAGVFLIPVITIILALTGPYNILLYEGSEVAQLNGLTLLDRDPGLWFWIITVYTYSLGALGAGLLLKLIRDRPVTEFRGQTLALLIGLTVPIISNILFLTGMVPIQGLDPTPLAFGISGLAYLGAITQFQLLSGTPTPNRMARNIAFDQMSQPAFIVDRNDFVIDINPAAAKAMDVDASKVTGKVAHNHIPEYNNMEQAIEVSQTITIETEEPRQIFECESRAVTNPLGTVVCHIITLNEVSRYIHTQQQLQVLHRAFRHNLRQQSQLMLGNISRLESSNDNLDEDLMADIRKSVTDLTQLGEKIKQIIEIFNIGTGASDQIDFGSLLDSTDQTLESESIEITTEVHCSLDEIYVHEVIRPVFNNILENAIEHNESESPYVHIEVDKNDSWLLIEVADNGPGIDNHEIDTIIRGEETQLDHTTGVGLWIITLGTELAGGNVEFSKDEPSGTIVSLKFPILSE